jgi:hypothetical protein
MVLAAIGGYATTQQRGKVRVAESELTPLSESIKQISLGTAQTEEFGDV